MRYTLDDSFLTGCELIDGQHGQLIKAVNALLDTCEEGKGGEELTKSLEFLNQYTINHFFDEEQLLKKHNYTDFYHHHQYHESFTKKVRDFSRQYALEGSSDDLIEKMEKQLGSWLVEHIKGQDFRWAEELRKKAPELFNESFKERFKDSRAGDTPVRETKAITQAKPEKKQRKTSIAVKITCLSSLLLFVTILVMTILGVYYMQNLAMATAVAEVSYRLNGGMIIFKKQINETYGALDFRNNQLVDSSGRSIEGHDEFLDNISRELDIAATIFVHDISGFRRLVTTLLDENGNRINGTRLLATNAALKPLSAGQAYMGEQVVIAGIPYIGYYEPIFSPSGELIGALFLGVEISSVETIIKEGSSRLMLTMVLVAAFLLAISLALNFGALRSWILSPMRKIIGALHKVEEGDIARQLRLPPGDEMGEIARHLDKTLENLKHLVMIIQNEAEAVDDIGEDLSANMDRTASAMNEINAAVQYIQRQITSQSSSIGATNDSIERITGNINKLSREIDIQSTNVSQSSSAIEELLANIESVTRIIRTNSENVTNLTEASETGKASLQAVASDIQEIARESEGLMAINAVMENIASQTNLLSMNAAIEAAHAGESGRGFAVVAAEIRKLAENSTSQSNTISTVLKKIRDSMAKISNATGQVLAKFEAIDSNVKTVSSQEEQIRNAMEEQSSGSRQILEAVEKLNEITRSVKSGSVEMLKESEEIINQGSSLRQVTSEITERMDEMAYRSGEVNSSVSHVNTISRKNKSNIDILREAITHFTITDKYYAWDDSYLIGDKHVDEQHKELFVTVNGLIDAIERGVGAEELKKTLDFLIQYTVTHFNDEEELQRRIGYPKLDAHHVIHEKFKKVAVELAGEAANIGNSETLIKEVKRKVGDWLVTHVTSEDARIGKFIRAEARR